MDSTVDGRRARFMAALSRVLKERGRDKVIDGLTRFLLPARFHDGKLNFSAVY